MNFLPVWNEPFLTALGWALIHFLCQGTLIALLLAAADPALRKSSANLRYALAYAAMILMLSALVVTFAWNVSAIPGAPGKAPGAGEPHPLSYFPAAGVPLLQNASNFRLQTWFPLLDCLWLTGVFLIAARSACGWFAAQRLKRSQTAPVEPVWELRMRRLAQALKISSPVRVLKSALARLPAVVGWFRPVILIPASALTGVDARHLEALLAHELAHIRRHDYLANLIQTAAETLLFYHPAVWWVGRKIRVERENCCDDLAVLACGDVLTYARALTRLEELRAETSAYTMAADGGVLITRIRRLIGTGQAAEHGPRPWLAAVLVLLTAGAVWATTQVAPSKPGEARPAGSASGQKPPAQSESGSFLADMAGAGYPDLTADELIAFKIHGVTAAYIRQWIAAGMARLTPDELLAFRIHGAEPKLFTEMKAAGFGNLTPDQIVAFRIHGVTPEFAAQMKALGFGGISPDRVLALKIHGVTAEYGAEVKALGLPGMRIDNLLAFRIHGVDPAEVREVKSLGLGTPAADQVVAMRIHGVTPEFIRRLMAGGRRDLDFDAVIAARIRGTSASRAIDTIRREARRLVADTLNQWKLTLGLPPRMQ